MTFSTKILLTVSVMVMAGGTFAAHADVTAKDNQVANFEPSGETPKTMTEDSPEMTIRDEKAGDRTEAGSCQIVCHPANPADVSKTALAKFDTSKMK